MPIVQVVAAGIRQQNCQHYCEPDCLQYGLANTVGPAAELASATSAWAETLAQGAPIAQKLGKQIMRQVHISSLEETIDFESDLQVESSTSQDTANVRMVFFEKKKPVFVGK